MGTIESISTRQSTKYEVLEELVREKTQAFIQDILEEEVEVFLRRGKSERVEKKVDGKFGYRNGRREIYLTSNLFINGRMVFM